MVSFPVKRKILSTLTTVVMGHGYDGAVALIRYGGKKHCVEWHESTLAMNGNCEKRKRRKTKENN